MKRKRKMSKTMIIIGVYCFWLSLGAIFSLIFSTVDYLAIALVLGVICHVYYHIYGTDTGQND